MDRKAAMASSRRATTLLFIHDIGLLGSPAGGQAQEKPHVGRGPDGPTRPAVSKNFQGLRKAVTLDQRPRGRDARVRGQVGAVRLDSWLGICRSIRDGLGWRTGRTLRLILSKQCPL